MYCVSPELAFDKTLLGYLPIFVEIGAGAGKAIRHVAGRIEGSWVIAYEATTWVFNKLRNGPGKYPNVTLVWDTRI